MPILVRPPAPLLPRAFAKVGLKPLVSKVAPPVPIRIVLGPAVASKAAPNFKVPPKKFRAPVPSLFRASAWTVPRLR